MTDAQASLAKVYTAARCRDTAALARDLHGGNGILLENHVARYSATSRRSTPTKGRTRSTRSSSAAP